MGAVKRSFVVFGLALIWAALAINPSLAVEENAGGEPPTAATAQPSNATRASQVIGKQVKNQQGEELGKVKDLIVNRDGQIDYLILERGGLFGMGGKLFPVPWEFADARGTDNTLIINIAKSRLDNAPSFASDQWPNFGEPAYQERLFGYYHQEPSTGTTEQPRSGQ